MRFGKDIGQQQGTELEAWSAAVSTFVVSMITLLALLLHCSVEGRVICIIISPCFVRN